MKSVGKVLLVLFLGVAMFGGGWFFGLQFSSDTTPDVGVPSELRHKGKFRFINPLLECDQFEGAKNSGFAKLKEELNSYAETHSKIDMAIYFRDLNNGPWFGINESNDFAPASLLKVPVLIASLKRCQTDPSLLELMLTYTPTKQRNDLIPNFNDDVLQPGTSYSIQELLRRMIVYSDNRALDLLLLEFVNQEELDDVWNELGMRGPDWMDGPELMISVKDYSAFFRILYNSTYLNREYSERALEILTKSNYNYGLKAGLPTDILVAHKFGERSYPNSDTKQLHDCGIVYHNYTPYLLCVMTKGTDWDELETSIRDISTIVFRNRRAS